MQNTECSQFNSDLSFDIPRTDKPSNSVLFRLSSRLIYIGGIAASCRLFAMHYSDNFPYSSIFCHSLVILEFARTAFSHYADFIFRPFSTTTWNVQEWCVQECLLLLMPYWLNSSRTNTQTPTDSPTQALTYANSHWHRFYASSRFRNHTRVRIWSLSSSGSA